jgi:hypothetical protein
MINYGIIEDELSWSKKKSSNSPELLTTIVFGELNWTLCVTIAILECVLGDTLKLILVPENTSFAVRNAWSRTLQSIKSPKIK